MDFQTEKVGDIMVVELPGKNLVARNCQEFKRDISPILEETAKVVFDMTALGFVDSSGCGAILSCLKMIKGKRGNSKIAYLRAQYKNLFDFTFRL